jgi:predicted nucleotidyltransferase
MLWIDRPLIEAAVRDYAAELKSRAGVQRIVWYGSWINGEPGPRSDVDLCIVVDASALSMRHRAPDFLPFGFPTGLDLVVLTAEEWRRLPEVAPSWHAAIEAGIEL